MSRSRTIPPELRRLRVVTVVFVAIIAVGVVGYVVISGMTLDEALYMTVITVTTVGFGEVVPLDGAGRLLTVGLIVAGVGSASYAAITAGEFLVEGHLGRYIERRRMHRAIDDLSDHVIICGYGRVGRHLAAALQHARVPFVIVESDEQKLEELTDVGLPALDGDATEEHTLEEAGLARASALVACVNTDADNVLVTLTAKGLRPEATVVARAKADENERKLLRAGADHVILPSSIGARRIASLLTRPVVTDFLEGLGPGGIDLTLDEVAVTRGCDLDGVALRDAGIRERWSVNVMAVRGTDGLLENQPSPEFVLTAGTVLVVLGGEREVQAMRTAYA